MKNLELALAFERVASLLELLGDSPFKIRAYRRVARTLMELPEPIEAVAERGELRKIPGVGQAIAAKIEQYLETGTIELLERLQQQVPESLLEVLEVPGIGPRTARLLWEQLGVRSLHELEQAARAGQVRAVKGMGARTEQAILQAVERWKSRLGLLPLPYLLSAADELLASLARDPAFQQAGVSGSVRRAVELGLDVDVVAAAPSVEAGARALSALGSAQAGPWPGTLRVCGRGPGGVAADVWVVPPELFAAALLVATGPEAHVEALLGRLRARGWQWREGRLTGPGGELRVVGEEAEFYRLAGLEPLPAELRWGENELEVAERGAFPRRLVEAEDLRGDLHAHTSESDGTASLREMAEAARSRGLEYLAITDHSPSLTVARGLTVERLQSYRLAIGAFNREEGVRDGTGAGAGRVEKVRLLAGSEVNVHPDGSLDYPDEVLEQLEWVVASVHSHFRLSRDEQTQRLLRACEHPSVHAIGHPTGRLLGRRDPYEADLEAVVQRAGETGTVLEINASPDRLDLDARWARRARSLGALLVISTDAHSPAQLGFARYGVLVARRAGLGPEDVLNTRPLEELQALIKPARRRG